MKKEDILEILPELLAFAMETEPIVNKQNFYVEVSTLDPMDYIPSIYRYWIQNKEEIIVEKLDCGSVAGSVKKTMREIVWKSCRLERVCTIYNNQYENWKKENNDIPYIETKINADSDGKPESSFGFIRNFWEEELGKENGEDRNLRLLLAEYGLGKSSYCYGIRTYAAEEIKEPFLSGNAAFPFVFDLNKFRSGDFEKFIESELFVSYKVAMSFSTFEKLCQNGIFMVVLDAWDQMRSARQVPQVREDLKQMSSLWEKEGRALITCRHSFYLQQLKIKGNLSKNVRLYKLNGFDQSSVIDYLNYNNKERQQQGKKLLISDITAWVGKCWNVNSDILEKPLNLKLLVRHFDIITRQIDFDREHVETYKFLEIIFEDWKEKNNVVEDSFLRELISQTLYSGLNRSISLSRYKNAIEYVNKKSILQTLYDFDFVTINEKEDQIEFCLAAYQEFLWSYFALRELETDPKDLGSSSLIRDYLLIKEVRVWMCMNLSNKRSDCLKNQLEHVKYRHQAEVGYCGSNALTLLCDLNKIEYYKEQLDEIKVDLWRSPLKGADVRGMDLSNADFHGSDLEGADFSFTKLTGAIFRGTDLAQTVWNEHGEMKKCAFLNQKDALCVVAGTSNGGVLTYRIDDKDQEVLNLRNDVINDLAGDRGGIYTASSDGWVGYIDKNGKLKNAYINRSGLQSIAHTNNENCVYVGAENQEIYRFNWNTGSRHRIEVKGELGHGEDRISDIHYYSNQEGEDYIAYTLRDRRLLILLKLSGKCEGKVIATGELRTENLKFGDICFADGMLIYSVVGKGVYGMPFAEVIGEIKESELLLDEQSLISLVETDSFSLGWASEKKKLMIAAKDRRTRQYRVYSVCLGEQNRGFEQIELDWICEGTAYELDSEQIKGFSVSDDGEFLAFSGAFLAVFQRIGSYYALTGEPVKDKISCDGADFSGSIGLSNYRKEFLKERNAIF